MEALSPRDVNALPKRTTDLKAKAAAQLRTAKDKDHPPPPPPQVVEPPSSDRKNGAVYQVGKLLGKGGFAICYDGKHVDSGKKYALKIVKSTMPVKMQQKVGGILRLSHDHEIEGRRSGLMRFPCSSKPSSRYTPR